MIGIETLLFVLGTGFVLLLMTLCFSLRDFSRSRLEQICKERRKVRRFGDILQSHERNLLVLEMLLLLLLIAMTWFATQNTYFDIFRYPINPDVWATVAWAGRLLSGSAALLLLLVVLPWTISRVRGEILLYRTWPLVRWMGRLTIPVWKFACHLDRIVHRVFAEPEPDSDEVTSLLTDELLTVVDESRREGVIHSNASTMIHRVVDLQKEDVAAIMTPRTDMVTIDANLTVAQALLEMLQNGFSRVPVIRDGVDDIVGILYARDLLAHASAEGTETAQSLKVHEIARDVLYAPESQGIGDLLEAMRQQKVHMAIVVDEYSGVSGLVTLEDILEEIVGDISDEYDAEDENLLKEHAEGRTEVDARYHLDDLNEEFGFAFPEDEEFDTIGGFVLSCFGRIPSPGETHFWNEMKLTVVEADERQIKRVRIEGDAPAAAGGNRTSAAG
ncbi:MAG: hypothetical protein Fues2KO_24810 [Fuerstiella sp.]